MPARRDERVTLTGVGTSGAGSLPWAGVTLIGGGDVAADDVAAAHEIAPMVMAADMPSSVRDSSCVPPHQGRKPG